MILGVKSVSVKKLHGYGHLEEIVVKRSDPQLYKFKEGDFVDLHLNDIEDMLLPAVQHKLFHLNGSDIVEFIMALIIRVRIRYSFLRSNQIRRDLPRDIPLVSVEVYRYDMKRSKSENKGIVPIAMELVLEQTQQGDSHEVSVSTEGVEELKRKVKIKGEKKEALLTLRQKPGKEQSQKVNDLQTHSPLLLDKKFSRNVAITTRFTSVRQRWKK
nr:hypothetical protein [Tanacetum cinerariifolium]